MPHSENEILVLRDNAHRELMQIKTVEAAMKHLNKIKGIEIWVKAEKKDAELQNIVAEQKLRTQRMIGYLIKEGQKNGDIASKNRGGANISNGMEDADTVQTLAEIGLNANQSSVFQKISDIPEDAFEAFIAEKKSKVNEAVRELTTAGALRLMGESSQTYIQHNRVTGYLNEKNSTMIRAIAHDKDKDVSDIVNEACIAYVNSIPEQVQRQMRETYLRDKRLREI